MRTLILSLILCAASISVAVADPFPNEAALKSYWFNQPWVTRTQIFLDGRKVVDTPGHIGYYMRQYFRCSTTNDIRTVCNSHSASTVLGNMVVASPPGPTALVPALVAAGVQVINLSAGRRPPSEFPGLRGLIEGLLAERDIVFVAAAGNDGAAPDFPANHPRVIGVAGSAPNGWRGDEIAQCRQPGECASNFGGNVQLAAPALNILSAWYPGNNFNPQVPMNSLCGDALHSQEMGAGSVHPAATTMDGYGLCTGTSMAAPIVTGVAGLVRSTNPLLSAANVRLVLQGTAQATSDSTLGYGIVQAQQAVERTLGSSSGIKDSHVLNRLTPLFSLYSATAEDYLYTTVPQMASAAIHDAGRRKYSSTLDPSDPAYFSEPTPYTSRAADPAVGGYVAFPGGLGQVPRAAAYIFTGDLNPFTRVKDLVPLYRLSYVADSATNPNNRDHTYTTDAAGIAAYQSVGYKLDGIEGYIFSKFRPRPTGAVKLLRRYNAYRDDHAIFPESQLAQMQTEGYTRLSGSDWIGYVYPNIDTDGDTLLDGFEQVLGTNPLEVDSDRDSCPDNIEYPLAGLPRRDPMAQETLLCPPSSLRITP